jgi:hypothetical protein
MFQNCSSLQTVPALNTTAVSSSGNFNNMFATCNSLSRIEAKDFRWTFSVANCKLSAAALDEIYTNLPTVSTTQTITVSGNWGATSYSRTSVNTTAGSTTISLSDTSNIEPGQEVSGAGISDAVAVTIQAASNTITRIAHGLVIVIWTTYYVVNKTDDTFQVALTPGGDVINLTGDGSGTILYGTTVVSVDPNTSVTISVPASATGSITAVFGQAKSSIARLKNWTVSG